RPERWAMGKPGCRAARTSSGAVTTTTASKRSSPPVSYRSGISTTATSTESSRPASQDSDSSRTRGCRRRSSHSSSAGSAKTTSAISGRSVVPKRSSSARRTSSSSAISRWTISSLEQTAAPCRAKAASASLFPAPIPPVSATLRRSFGVFAFELFGRRLFGFGLGLCRRSLKLGLGLVRDGHRLGLDLLDLVHRAGNHFGRVELLDPFVERRRARLREDLLREAQRRSALGP